MQTFIQALQPSIFDYPVRDWFREYMSLQNKKTIKILHVFSAPQSVFFFLDKQFDFMIQNECEIHVIMPKDDFYTEKLLKRELNVKFHFVPLKREISLLDDLRCLFIICFIILKLKPDILHLHTPKASFIGALAGRICFQKHILFEIFGLVSSSSGKKNVIYYMEKYTCSLATNVYAISESLRDFAIANGYCAMEKISLIANGTNNGIDWKNKFNPANLSHTEKYLTKKELNGKFVVGYLGRISIEKGIEDYLLVISHLQNAIPVLGVIVGKNEMGDEFENLLNKYDINNKLIIFTEVEDPENVMCDFDVLLFPSKREGFGYAILEASSLSIPVVGYDIPGVKSAIENEVTGKLVEYADVAGLEKSIYDYYLNKDKKIAHGINGRERIKRLFTQEELWVEILNTYRKLIN